MTLVLTIAHTLFQTSTSRWHFESFYATAQMLRHGEAGRLYDLAAQADFQMRFADAGRFVETPDFPFVYPAAILIPFFLLSFLPITIAYAVWTALNLSLLLASVRVLQRFLPGLQGDWLFLIALLFAPVSQCLLHGQFSILLLFLYLISFSLMRDRPFLSGTLVGLATFKFQLVLGFVAVLVLRKNWKWLCGVVAGGFVILGLSTAIAGWRQIWTYPQFLRAVEQPHSQYLNHMVNLRGLLVTITGVDPPISILAILSLVLIVIPARAWPDDKSGYSIAIITTILGSYYVYTYDLSLLVFPLAVMANRLAKSQQDYVHILLLVVPIASFGMIVLGLRPLFVVAEILLLIILWKTSPLSGELCTGVQVGRPS